MTRTGTILDRILERTRADLAERQRSVPESALLQRIRQQPKPVPLAPALRGERIRVIAELKRGSPSRGLFAPDADARVVVTDYLAGGAAALSVLTDRPFFFGSLDDLTLACGLAHAAEPPRPVLRKDFLIDPYQVLEARACGADAVLLIAAALDTPQLASLLRVTWELGMEALVEVHDEGELERALAGGARVIGINNRDLRTFTVDPAVSERLAPQVPEGCVLVAESGIRSVDDVRRLAAVGIDAVLVGESLMVSPDRRAAVAELASVEAQRCRDS